MPALTGQPKDGSDLVLELGDTGGDFTLKERERSVWVQVGNITVQIIRLRTHVLVALYPSGRGEEDHAPMVTTKLTFKEAEAKGKS